MKLLIFIGVMMVLAIFATCAPALIPSIWYKQSETLFGLADSAHWMAALTFLVFLAKELTALWKGRDE